MNFFTKILFLYFLLTSICIYSQSSDVKKLLNEQNISSDTNKVKMYLMKAENLYGEKGSFYYCNKAIKLSKKINYKKGEASGLFMLALNHSLLGNNSKALDLNIQSLKISEANKDTIRILNNYQNISSLYDDMENYKMAFDYAYKGYKTGERTKYKEETSFLLWCCGFYQFEMKNCDTSLHYFQKSLDIYNTLKNNIAGKGRAYSGLGMANSCMNNKDIASSYFNKATTFLKKAKDGYYLMLNYQYKAQFFKKNNEIDSSIVYFNKANEGAIKNNYVKLQLDNYSELANLYSKIDKDKSIEYYQISNQLRDSLYNFNKKNELELLTLNEQERQEKIIEKQKEEEENRKENIQYSIIILGLITFTILILIFSRSIVVNTKIIKLLGIVALLLIFEFINLLIHPFLEKITHHSPILMLLCLVAFAFMLVPLHHKIEKWAVHKLIERNEISRKKYLQKMIEEQETEDEN